VPRAGPDGSNLKLSGAGHPTAEQFLEFVIRFLDVELFSRGQGNMTGSKNARTYGGDMFDPNNARCSRANVPALLNIYECHLNEICHGFPSVARAGLMVRAAAANLKPLPAEGNRAEWLSVQN
jgi:hypothetical protein